MFYPKLYKLHIFPANDLKLVEAQKKENRLEFELVETPDDARTDTPPDDTKLLSDKNAVARDEYQQDDKLSGNPYSEGNFDVKELPVNNPEQMQMQENTQANQNDSKDEEQKSRNKERPDYETGKSYEKFSRQQLLGNASTNQVNQQQRKEKPLYENKKFSADDLGGFSFSTYNWNFAPYMLEMKNKVESNLFPPPAFTHMGLISGQTLVRFKVMPNGEVKDLVVLKHSGHPSLEKTSINSIQNSSPFKPLPADFPDNFLEVTASVSYYINR